MKNFTIPYGTCELNDDGYLSHINEKPSYNFLINTDLDRTARLSDEELSLRLKKEVSTSVSDILDTWMYR